MVRRSATEGRKPGKELRGIGAPMTRSTAANTKAKEGWQGKPKVHGITCIPLTEAPEMVEDAGHWAASDRRTDPNPNTADANTTEPGMGNRKHKRNADVTLA